MLSIGSSLEEQCLHSAFAVFMAEGCFLNSALALLLAGRS